MLLKGKVVLVTGGGKRVGRAITMALAKAGADVAITYRNSQAEALATMRSVRRFGVKGKAYKVDLCEVNSLPSLIRQVKADFKHIDVLVNNASVYLKTLLFKTSEQEWDTTFASNLKAPFFLAKTVAPVMLKQGHGKIINIADWAGLRPYLDYIPYCLSKTGIIYMTYALAKALAPKIQVNAVAPGPVLLPENWGSAVKRKIIAATPLKRIGSPEDVARAVLFLIEGSDFITGALLPVDGGRLIA